MTGAIRMHETGGPGVLRWESVDLPDHPGPGEARVRHTAVGLNFIDTYHRTGLYPVPLPSGLGAEAAGVVEALGSDVHGFVVGDRVAYATGPLGAYAEARNVGARHLVKVPDGVDDALAAAVMLKGMTAEYLVRRTYPVSPGETVLVRAAAGGVGSILCQWASHLGARVIGTVGSADKAALASEQGCADVLVEGRDDVPGRVRELTGGEGVPVVYDSVGKDTFAASLDCVRRRGLFVTYGNASGPVEPFSPRLLAQKGSIFVTRPTLGDYVHAREELEASAAALFQVLASGAVKVRIGQTYPLSEAARAHGDLEARRTTGSTVLLP